MIYSEDIAERTGSRSAYFRIMEKLGDLLVSNKKEVVDLLNESGVYSNYAEDENSLANKFVINLPKNPKLMLNTSVFLESFNRTSNFIGEIGDNIKKNYYTMRVYLGQEDFSNNDGLKGIGSKIGEFVSKQGDSGGGAIGSSTAQGAASGGVVGAVAGAIGDVAKLGTKISEGQQKKKYGAQDLAQKREESRNALLMAAMQNKMAKQETDKKKQEQQEKTKKTVIIISSVVGVVIIGLIVYALIKKK